ncbi:hypothetical protein BDV25DRAFT_145266 [Aspergillus avenaceus]|uniref:Uncharacterized protein n=1 Tax=Aspergillus avenaceus TaxID=36643 RepID=A0A5N6TEJ7_ASPAV|nr:hypothetical protein BDV25DRAFT_145266 [Aspergillus avenaceus]
MSQYLADLIVIYATNAYAKPDGLVDELQGATPDINNGHGGFFTWLVPRWTETPSKAITSLSILISDSEHRNYNDMALNLPKGHRYVIPERDGDKPITKVGLYRTPDEHTSEEIEARIRESGYTNYTTDINKNRGGDYLYLVWAY